MTDTAMMGIWQFIVPIPGKLWKEQIPKLAKQVVADPGFMSEEHSVVHRFVVSELPRVGEPLSPGFIAKELGLTIERVTAILDELEKHMTFLYRNNGEAVVWAYPVTIEETPHHITFSTGEQLYAA